MKKNIILISAKVLEQNDVFCTMLQCSLNCDVQVYNLSDFVESSCIVIHIEELTKQFVCAYSETGILLPIFIIKEPQTKFIPEFASYTTGIIDLCVQTPEYYIRQISSAIDKYENNLLPPFFNMLTKYVEMGNSAFDCPGHQGGQFFRKHPAGRKFYDFFGENLFRSDLCNADVALGDLLIHEGSAHKAQAHAAKVYNADKTYFVLNGTSSANKIVCNALCTPGDFVLFDRNNHKSNHHGALVQAGAMPIYLETARNPYGFIGGIDERCFDEAYVRSLIAKHNPEKATEARPFRLAIIQLGTYDGTIYNARFVVDKIGHLCDYILFDSAWVGYEQFIPMMKDCSPLLLDLKESDPGIIVTQSVHKQQAGFSQTSQIHKKDSHIKTQKRYCNHKHLNNAFMMHASTSPFYPLFAALDVNAKIHEGEAGRKLWNSCVQIGIDTRKAILESCHLIKPFIPDTIEGKPWKSYSTKDISENRKFFAFEPEAKWHKFSGYGKHQYFVDPCKLLLTTPGIDEITGEYAEFGIPATLLANFLRENGIIPEKCDLNSILFLMTPAEDMSKMYHLVSQIKRFELMVENDITVEIALPSIYNHYKERYQTYTLKQLCQEMHEMYKAFDVKDLQKNMFRENYLPEMVYTPQEANIMYFRNECDYVKLSDAIGRVAAEGALPYPPGILCVVSGEIWTPTATNYFLALEEGINRFPGFAPEIQGVYLEELEGKKIAHCYVLNK